MQSQPMATCPFNSAHKFIKDKLVFHITRCKDKQKVIHLYAKCQYNAFHYILKQDVQLHECCCSSRGESIALVERLKKTFRQSLRQPRERSRQRDGDNNGEMKSQQGKGENMLIKSQDCDAQTLEECEQCQNVLKMYKEQIMKGTNEKLKRFILKYYELANEEF